MVTWCGSAVLGVMLFVYLFAYAPAFGIETAFFSLGDVLALVMAGAAHFEVRPGVFPPLPLGWLAMINVILSATLLYPFRDMRAAGGLSLLLSGSRLRWIASKMIWAACATVGALLVLVVVSAMISAGLGFSPDLSLHREAFELAGVWMDYLESVPSSILLFLVQAVLILLALVEVQLLLGVFFHPLVGFGLVTAYLVAGVYIEHPAFLGNGMMFARWGHVISNGVPSEPMAMAAVFLLASACSVACWAIRKLDVLERKGEQ